MNQQGVVEKKIWVTLSGLPLTMTLEWPFHPSTSGADFWVLHGDIVLEGSEGLHAPVAVNLSQTVREVMPSLEPKDAETPVINALRKEVDRRQIEFVKSGKLLPVPFSSRHYDFKRQQWVFGKASDEAMAEFVERKVFWQTQLGKSPLLAKDARNGAPGSGDNPGDPGLDWGSGGGTVFANYAAAFDGCCGAVSGGAGINSDGWRVGRGHSDANESGAAV